MMISIGIEEKQRQEISNRLNILLANEYVLYTKTLNYHWNITSTDFDALHAFLKKQYEELFEFVDAVAERITTLGFKAYGTLDEFKQHTDLNEYPGDCPRDQGMIKNLLIDHETIIKKIRQDLDVTIEINDAGTNNFLADLLEKHEKMAWMLRSHLV